MKLIVNFEKHITGLIKDLRISEVISEVAYKSLIPQVSRFGILYGLCKVRKQLVDNCPPFRPIMSAIKTPTYNLAKFLVPLLEPITTNMYTVKSSLEFAKEIADQDPRLFMIRLDVVSLFTKIPLGDTISVRCDSLFSNDAKVNDISRIGFEKLLTAVLQSKILNFKGKMYKQVHGVAMISSRSYFGICIFIFP